MSRKHLSDPLLAIHGKIMTKKGIFFMEIWPIFDARPKPPNGRQDLAGLWGKDTIRRVHFGVVAASNFAPTVLSLDCFTLFGYWWGVSTDLSEHSLRKWSFFVTQSWMVDPKVKNHQVSNVWPACRTHKFSVWNIFMAAINEKCQN